APQVAAAQAESKEARLQRQMTQLQREAEATMQREGNWADKNGIDLSGKAKTQKEEEEGQALVWAFNALFLGTIYGFLNGTIGWWNYDENGRKLTAEEYKKANGVDKPNLPGSW
ncbi:unnamed protein product, partial [Prorocentrum cordatum]